MYMTNQEFINSLSPKAKKIIENYNCNNSNKRTIMVYLTDYRSQVDVSQSDKYIIEVKRNDIFDNMEYEFLHEFYHCVQMDEKFPNLTSVNSNYSKIANILSSIVLDLDVNKRLSISGYAYNSNQLKENFNTIKKLIVISKHDAKVNEIIHEINQYIYICSMIAFIRFNYDNQEEIMQLLQFIKMYSKDFYNDQSIIYNAIQKIGFNTPKKVFEVFKTLIHELNLQEYIQIS